MEENIISQMQEKGKNTAEKQKQIGSRNSITERRTSKRNNILRQIILDVIEEQVIYEKFKVISSKQKSNEDSQFILTSLKKHFVFSLHTDLEL